MQPLEKINYKQCTKCVMDTDGNVEIEFDDNGICNYCYEYEFKSKTRLVHSDKREFELKNLVKKIKLSRYKNEYDCIIGVSGGVDSTYTAYLTKKLGLRPLAVHFDNGWNSELAVHNIEKTLNILKIDLHTFVIDWEEFKELQISFLKSSTPDGEIPTDHAILATLYKIASQYNIKYIISGNNFKNEGVMPRLWAYGHIDWKYIKSVHSLYSPKRLKTYPYFNLSKFIFYTFFRGIKMVSILNYIDYDKDDAMETLTRKLHWEYYGGKHYESNYTKNYQGVILPKKFNIDKRKLHLSALILSKQLSRKDALRNLENLKYPIDQLKFDTEYVIKKLGLDKNEFDKIMSENPKTFLEYPNNYLMHSYLRRFLSYLRTKKLFHN